MIDENNRSTGTGTGQNNDNNDNNNNDKEMKNGMTSYEETGIQNDNTAAVAVASSSSSSTEVVATSNGRSSSSSSSSFMSKENENERLSAMEILVQEYHFSRYVITKAFRELGTYDINEIVNYIFDNGLGEDNGGSVVPKLDCPHITHLLFQKQQQQQQQQPLTTMTPSTTTTSSSSTSNNKSAKPVVVVDWDKFNVCTYYDNNNKKDYNSSHIGEKKKGDCCCDGDNGENWLCLQCHAVNCSRYVQGHALTHWQESCCNEKNDKDGHCIAISLADLSVWCYVCNSYLKHPKLYPIIEELHKLKFPNHDHPPKPSSSSSSSLDPISEY